MTREEYIFKNAADIAEQRIRAGRSMQAMEAKRIYSAALAKVTKWSKLFLITIQTKKIGAAR